MRIVLLFPAALLLIGGSGAFALDHDNLDKNRPLQIEDAYPIPKGEVGVETGLLYRNPNLGEPSWEPRLQMLAAPFYNTQIEVGGSRVRESDPSGSDGRLWEFGIGALYNFNTETMTLPAMAVKLELDFKTGEGSKADFTLGGLLTRSCGRWRGHLNLSYTRLGSDQEGERSGIYRAVAGASYPLGYPMRFRETIIADIFTRQSARSGEKNVTGVEVGLRHQLSPRIVLDAGVGTEFSGPSDRSVFLGTVGLSAGF